MKTMIILTASIAVLGTSLPAMAGEGDDTQKGNAYVNLGATRIAGAGYALVGRGGYDFARYFGVEAEVGIGVSERTVSFARSEFGTGVKFSLGGFAVGRLPVSEKINLFGRVGYHYTEIDFSFNGNTTGDVGTDGIAFGGGVEYMFDGQNGVRLGYTRYDNTAFNANASGFSAAYVRRF